jgi:hypothetical protein
MTWVEIMPPAAAGTGAAKASAVTMTATEGVNHRPRRISIAVRPDQLEGLEFFRAGERVRVMIGHGEQAGMLRIMPGKSFALRNSGGNAKQCPMLYLPEITGMAKGKFSPTAVEFDYGGEGADAWLEITLPAWARPAGQTAPAPAPTDAQAGPRPALAEPRGPFKGALASQPHSYPAATKGGAT